MNKVTGYFILNVSTELFLTHEYTWGSIQKEFGDYAYVFTEDEIFIIKSICNTWKIQPVYMQKAEYFPDTNESKAIGQLERFWNVGENG